MMKKRLLFVSRVKVGITSSFLSAEAQNILNQSCDLMQPKDSATIQILNYTLNNNTPGIHINILPGLQMIIRLFMRGVVVTRITPEFTISKAKYPKLNNSTHLIRKRQL